MVTKAEPEKTEGWRTVVLSAAQYTWMGVLCPQLPHSLKPF